MTVGHRYPLHEIERILDWPLEVELAEIFDVKVSTVAGWKRRGLSHRQADELASRLNHTGIELWGMVFEEWPKYPEGTDVTPPRVRPASGIGSHQHQLERAAERARSEAA
jgi:hypothetical protein